MSDFRHAGIHWPSNAGGEHPSTARILSNPGVLHGCLLITAESARYWYRQARGACPLVVWRAIPRREFLPARLGWDPKRVADECLNLWNEQPHGGIEWFLPLNELQLEKEAGEVFPGYAKTAERLGQLRLQLRRKFSQQYPASSVKLVFPAWVPQDELERSYEWVSEALLWDAVCLHAYGSASEIVQRFRAYRELLGPDVLIFMGEWNANHTEADERVTLEALAKIGIEDPNFMGATYYIWETQNEGENDLSIWGNEARLTLFTNPPGAEEVEMPDLHQYARDAASSRGINPDIFERQIQQESGFNPDAHNDGSGADGIAQIVVRWHPAMAGKTRDPLASLDYAADLMRSHLDYWIGKGHYELDAYGLALSSYNAGRQATIDGLAGNKPGWPFNETIRYLAVILNMSAAGAADILTGRTTPSGQAIKLSEVLTRGRSRVGDPYVWDGEQPGGFDCSGFVKWCYNGALTSFTDAIFDETSRIETPAPGDIVLYEYADASQPNVRFPHCGLFLSDGMTLDARGGMGVGEREQLPRSMARRYYRRAPNILVDTGGAVEPPRPSDEAAQLRAERDRLIEGLAVAADDHGDAIQRALDAIRTIRLERVGPRPQG